MNNPNISIIILTNYENNINDSLIDIISKTSFKIANYINNLSLHDIEVFTY